MLAIGFVGGLANLVCWVLGVFFVIGGTCSFINGSASLGWQGLIVGILGAVVPQALTLWGAEGIGCLKELLGRV
ncbi:hypothetical protein [Eubacterium sp.]|uniref:hypothetical protein n=1 Tax=Eubacterium sp. TaxID=142586 RepID=UPI00258511AF|nr:hypothetical protein [Eubacterium sp.]MCR5367697.1 hypothetical protein [Eubacterium sp.]